MLSPDTNRFTREKVFKRFSKQICIIALKKDSVFPADYIRNTISTGKGMNYEPVNLMDFPFHYTHETPFPVFTDKRASRAVDHWFDVVFTKAGRFFSGK
jgi:hypothetical protein